METNTKKISHRKKLMLLKTHPTTPKEYLTQRAQRTQRKKLLFSPHPLRIILTQRYKRIICLNKRNKFKGVKCGSVHSVALCEAKGFTLVEIIVSITLLAIVFLSLYQFFFKSYYFSRNVNQKEVALLLARKKAEHTLAGIEAEHDTVTVDTLDGTIYRTILKTSQEIPPSCSIKVYVNKEGILVIQMLKP